MADQELILSFFSCNFTTTSLDCFQWEIMFLPCTVYKHFKYVFKCVNYVILGILMADNF